MPDPFSMAMGIGSLASTFFGGDDGGSPQQQSTMSGYNALPPEAQQAWQNFFGMLNQLSGRVGGQPDLNQTQQNALGQYANPDYSMQGMSQYMNPFMNQVQERGTNAINRQYDIGRSNLMGDGAMAGSRVNNGSNSALNTQLAMLEEAKNRNIGEMSANLGYQGYNEGMNLRQNSLANMLNAGNIMQQAPYNKVGMYGQLAGMMPNNSSQGSQIGQIDARPTMMSKFGQFGQGLGTGLYGDAGWFGSGAQKPVNMR